MTEKFISNEGLLQLLNLATADERLALTRTLSPSSATAWTSDTLKTELVAIAVISLRNSRQTI